MDNVLVAFLLTLFAGLATTIGSAISFFAKKDQGSFLSVSLGFSAGVMIYIAMIEMFSEAVHSLESIYSESTAYSYATIAFFVGILIIMLIDKLVPDSINPHEPKELMFECEADMTDAECQELKKQAEANDELMKTGLFSALAVAIHNFPEGIATFASALVNPTLGLSVAIAVAIHNIPEGIAVSIPIYYATGDKKKAFIYSALSGLTEPLGALAAYVVLLNVMSDALLGLLFAGVAGIMVFISLDELLPTAEKHGQHHHAIYGLVSGMLVMAISLVLLG